MKLTLEEIVELINREMYTRTGGIVIGATAAAKAIMQAEEEARAKDFETPLRHSEEPEAIAESELSNDEMSDDIEP